MDFNIIISILFGFFVAFLLFITTHKFYEYRGPNSNEIKKNIYKLNDKCYKFVPVVHICPIK